MSTRLPLSRLLLLAGATLLLPSCSDAPAAPSPAADLPALVVSSARGLTTTEPRAWVSLPRQSVPGGGDAIVTNRVTGASVRRALADGGLDPVAIGALPGDELTVEIVGVGTAERVVTALPPVIVRTDPSRRRRSVPLNAHLLLVFSEPMDPASMTGAITLEGPNGPEAITTRLSTEGTIVMVEPRAPLRPSSDYRILVGTSATDLAGDHLEKADIIEFSTASVTGSIAAVRLCPDTLTLPVGVASGFAVVVDSGRRVINRLPDPELTWRSADTTIARITPAGDLFTVGIGRTWIFVTWHNETDSSLLTVTDWPPPGPFRIWPQGATMPIGHTDRFVVSHYENEPAPAVTWSVSNSSIISVDTAGGVTGVAAGTAWVYVRSATNLDSAEIEVYDPAPKLGQLYVIRPDTVLFQPGDLLWLAVSGPEFPAPAVTWTSADPSVATVLPSGAITAQALGHTTITATFADGSSASAPVIVVERGTLGTISLVPANPTVHVGDTLRLNVTMDARAQSLWGNLGSSWTLVGAAMRMQIGVAGSFIAVAPGTATIRTYAGPLWAEARVTVVP